MKLKAFFIIFERLSSKEIKVFFLEDDSPTLKELHLRYHFSVNLLPFQLRVILRDFANLYWSGRP